MSKLFKYLSIGLATAFLLVMIIIGGIFLFVDPNDFKGDITAAVHEATGRDLTISGDISLSIYPWLGLSLGETTLSNAQGFGESPFAQVQKVDIKVKLLPLLSQRLEMQKVRLHGLHASLAIDKNGRSNWDDLASPADSADKTVAPSDSGKPEKEATEKPAEAMAAIPALALEGLELQDARLEWNDQLNNQRIVIDKLTLQTGPVSLPAPVDLSLSMDLQMNQPEINAHIDLSGQLAVDLATQQYRADNLNLKVSATGSGLPASPLDAQLQSNIIANLKNQTLGIRNLQINTLGAQLSGQVDVTGLNTDPEASGQLKIAQLSPRELAKRLAISLPETGDSSVLTKALLDMEFIGNANQVNLKKLDVTLDDTQLAGTASVKNFASPVIRFNLDVDDIDVDRYLPPPSTEDSTGKPAAAESDASAAIALPLEPLRTLDIDGNLTLGKLKVAGAQLSELQLGLHGKGGQVRLHPVQASLYNGRFEGDIKLDVRTDTPRVSIDEKLTSVNIGPLLKDVLGKEYVSGKANVAAQLHTKGLALQTIKQNLNGKANFSFLDGKVNGVNIGQVIREAYAKLKKKPAPPKTENATDFASLSGSVAITNGIVRNDDLNAKSPLLRIKGKGKVDLPKERIKYLVNAAIVESNEGQAGKELEELKSHTLPIKVTGKLTDPKFSLDLGPVLQKRIKKQVDKRIKKEKKKIKKKIEKDLKKKLEEDLKKKLGIKF